jgi:hypothetical protein
MGDLSMKTIQMLAAATLVTLGLASAASARPDHHPMPHHRHCSTHFVHGHRVTRCI